MSAEPVSTEDDVVMVTDRFVVVLLTLPTAGGLLYRAVLGHDYDTARPDERVDRHLWPSYDDAVAFGDAQDCWGYRIEKWMVKGDVDELPEDES